MRTTLKDLLRRAIWAVILAFSLVPMGRGDERSDIAMAQDLAAEAKQAGAKRMPLVGMTPAFYGAYLDRAIEQGVARLRNNAPAR